MRSIKRLTGFLFVNIFIINFIFDLHFLRKISQFRFLSWLLILTWILLSRYSGDLRLFRIEFLLNLLVITNFAILYRNITHISFRLRVYWLWKLVYSKYWILSCHPSSLVLLKWNFLSEGVIGCLRLKRKLELLLLILIADSAFSLEYFTLIIVKPLVLLLVSFLVFI